MTDLLDLPHSLRDNGGLNPDDKELRRMFPAVFNHRPSPRVSEDYQLYRSFDVIEQFLSAGLKLTSLGQQKSRQRDPRTQLHIMRFAPSQAPEDFGLNDAIPELIVMNSHDGRNRFQCHAGVFRFICSNGMVVADSLLGSVSRRHYGLDNTQDKVLAVLADMPKMVTDISDRIKALGNIRLTFDEQHKLATKLAEERGTPDWVSTQQLLTARRSEEEQAKDGTRSAWITFNVLQENLTNQSISREEGRGTLRPIQGVFNNFDVNERLWGVAETYIEKIRPGSMPQLQIEVEAIQKDEAQAAENLADLTIGQLVERHNELNPEAPVKRFSSKPAGIARIEKLLNG